MASLEYLDSELYLTDYDQAKLTVAGRDYSGRPAFNENLLRQLLEENADSTQYGTLLFNALFPMGDDLLTGYRDGLAIARHIEKRLRFRLHIAATAPTSLYSLDWELLFDSREEMALSRSRDTVFSRFASVPLEAGVPKEIEPKLLVVISNPTNLAKYNLVQIDRDMSKQKIEEALRPLAGISYEFLDGPATLGRISDSLVKGGFHILHIYAHGQLGADRSMANLVLEFENGTADFVDEKTFSQIFEGERDLRLIMLIACYGSAHTRDDPFGGLGQSLVKRGCPAVIAMRQAIGLEAANRFSREFYLNLVRSGQVDVAMNEARSQIFLASRDSEEWSIPTLFMRLPDGKLWINKAPPPPPPQPVSKILNATLRWMGQRKVVPILGPEITRGLLPLGTEIAERWAKKSAYFLQKGRNDLPGVAKFVETMDGRNIPHLDLLDELKAAVIEREHIIDRKRLETLTLTDVIEKMAERHFDLDEDEPHRILANLPISTYVTTNYDSLMTAALKWVGRKPQRRSCLWRGADTEDTEYRNLKGTDEAPLVFHMYGYDDPTSLVLTEDDYLDFLRNVSKDEWRIPQFVRETLVDSVLLFLGFNISDLEWRILFRGLVAQLRDMRRDRIAVLQIDPDRGDTQQIDELRNFLERYCSSLNVKPYWRSLREFLVELRDELRV